MTPLETHESLHGSRKGLPSIPFRDTGFEPPISANLADERAVLDGSGKVDNANEELVAES